MTGNLLIDSAISIAGIILMVIAARLAFGKPGAVVTADAVRDRLILDEPDFEPTDWLIDESAGAALARNADGEIAAAYRLGGDIVTRRFAAGSLGGAWKNGALITERPDHTSPQLRLSVSETAAADWLKSLRAL